MGKWLLKPTATPSRTGQTPSACLECDGQEVQLEHSADLLKRLLAELDRIGAALWEQTFTADPRPPAGPPPAHRPLPAMV
ncbi:hypothetical protein AB0I49_23295 [Streptomyces sp. NPDC050617]|uniref:hypothetical protein n=1 Tax=Streptomyces sp. NPDC050617 TaxID=3154628 RepID=UPI003420AB82